MRRPHDQVWRERDGQQERRCARCGEWLDVAKFYFDTQAKKFRSFDRECFMADIIARKRRKRDPFGPLIKAWGQ